MPPTSWLPSCAPSSWRWKSETRQDAAIAEATGQAALNAAQHGGSFRNQSGGIGDINVSGNLKVGGNFSGSIGGDANVTTTTTGSTPAEFADAFNAIYQKIAAKPREDQVDLKEAVDTIKQAAEKEAAGEKPDAATEKEVKSASQAIVATSPDLIDDVLEVATATLANPAAGVAMIVRKVLEKARALRGGATA